MVMNILQIYKEMGLEQGIIKDGVIKIYKESTQDHGPSNEKPLYWNKDKNIVTDGVIDTRHVHFFREMSNIPTTFLQQQPYEKQPPIFQ